MFVGGVYTNKINDLTTIVGWPNSDFIAPYRKQKYLTFIMFSFG